MCAVGVMQWIPLSSHLRVLACLGRVPRNGRTKQGVQRYLGLFETELQAALAYDVQVSRRARGTVLRSPRVLVKQARLEYGGDAKTNFMAKAFDERLPQARSTPAILNHSHMVW
jgi:hypothetical protein